MLEESSPHLTILIAGLAVAAASDVAQRRIPNVVVAPLAAAGLAAQWLSGGAGALGGSALAGALALLLLLGPWSLGWVGGGDVKLAAAVATWLGLGRLAPFLVFSAVAGGPVGLLARLSARRASGGAFVRAPAPVAPPAAVPAPETAPVAVAIALGALAALRWGLP